ncbi:MAG: sensor domain-containing diguanylate cyclase [Nitrospira sp.]|nr:sensor domain-containing diguanylate cyclase [Nitrospira sp.]
MAKQTVFDTSRLPDELARVTQELAHAQGELRHSHQRLTALHCLTDALASSTDEEAIIKVLTKGLPSLVDPVMVGVARSHRNRAWIWSDSQNREREAQVRRYLMRRLGQSPAHDVDSDAPPRGGRSRHLRLVPSSASQQAMQEQDATLGEEVPLALGSEENGLLLVQLKDPDHFTPREREALETVGASLSLALRHARTQQRARAMALRDPLTDLLNLQAFESALMRELSVGLRYGVPACLLLLDLDFFRIVNDRLGHTAGDQVLKMAADLIRGTVRDSDIAGRYRGNTFAVVLPHTDRQQARALAERLRERVERYPFTIEDGQVRTTASIGLAAVPDATVVSVAEWMMVGDAALNDAKAQGRNRVVLHAPKPPGVACAVALSCAA